MDKWRLIFTFLIVLLSVNNSFSQKVKPIDSLKIIEGIQDTSLKISIIPIEALNGSFDILVEGIYYDIEHPHKLRGFKIFWNSNVISGRNVICINPKQIYLRTEHDNPYPSYLYWIINISSEQYIAISKIINDQTGNIFSDKTTANSLYKTLQYNYPVEEETIPYDWTYKEILKHKKDYKMKLYTNFRDILKLFNKATKQKELQIPLPSLKEFDGVKPIRTIYLMEQYGDEFNDIKYNIKSE